MLFNTQFKINMQGTEHLSELEKNSVKWYQILQQCEGDFRSLSQNVIPALLAIGTENPSLIIESVKLLASSNFLGSITFLTARCSGSGLELLSKSIPEVSTYLKNKKVEYITDLIEKRSKIPSPEWQEYTRITKNLLSLTGTPYTKTRF